MIFMVHPQPDFDGAATHTLLGMFIILGAIFFLGEKWHQFPEDLYESWNIVLAGGLYLFASSLLIRYEEAPIVMHHGYNTYCHRGAPVTFACLIVAGQSGVLLLWFGCMDQRLVRGCMARVEVFHEDPYGFCCQGKWRDVVVEEEEEDRSGGVVVSVGVGGGGEGGGGGRSYGEGEGDALVPIGGGGRYSRNGPGDGVELV